MKPTTNHSIIKYLETQDGYVFGGVIARAVHDLTGTKESVVERRLRELTESGIVEVMYEKVNGKGPKVVKYRLCGPKQPLGRTETTISSHSPVSYNYSVLPQYKREVINQKLL